MFSGYEKEYIGEPKETKMKPQFTEEEADDFYEETDLDQIIERKYFIEKLKNSGYIRKSDLEILIEEAEEIWRDSKGENKTILEYKQHDCIQAMKTELNKRKDK